MTRNGPSGEQQSGVPFGQPQAPYGGGGFVGQGNDYAQSYQQQSNYAPQGYGQPSQAQSYYGLNEQPYQHYPQDQREAPPRGQYYQGPPAADYPQHEQYQYGQQQYGQPPPPQQYPTYGSPSPLPQNPASYGQEYAGQHYLQNQSGDIDAFKSHFDQPNASSPMGGPFTPNQGGPGTAEDRGFLGAVAGGAAGAYGGHKMGHHGIIGGIGGAIAGSMLEDAAKKHHKKEKKEKKKKHGLFGGRRGSSSSSSSSSSDSSDDEKDHHRHNHGPPAGNFAASSHGMHIEGHSTLVADCKDVNGHHHRSHLDLNDCFTNTNGGLFWAPGGNFAASSRHIRLAGNGEWLEAELNDGSGQWVHNKVWLNERITNDNGRLHMLA